MDHEFGELFDSVVTPNGNFMGRTVWHDPRSRGHELVPAELRSDQYRSVHHVRHIPVLDQGQLGSCTGNAGTGLLGTGKLWATLPQKMRTDLSDAYLAEEFAVTGLYKPATHLDPYAGTYPPSDTGSSGLAVAKVIQKQLGLIDEYKHAFSIKTLITGLQQNACMVGTIFTEGMENPDRDGYVEPAGSVLGGHEYVCDEFVLNEPGKPFHTANVLGFTNSWNTTWGKAGRFYMTVGDFVWVLNQQGDATFLIPRSS